MLIKIQKRNNGVAFIPLLLGEKQPAARTAKSKPFQEAIQRAVDWYCQEVINAFENRGISSIGYAEDFRKKAYAEPQSDGSRLMQLNPWGFAFMHEACEGKGCVDCGNTGVGMNDSGSTPTVGRARALACYQAPLKMVKETVNSYCRFEIVREF